MALRALVAMVVTVLGVAGAVVGAGFLEIDKLTKALEAIPGVPVGTDLPEPGEPQTIMLLGTDGRLGADAGGGQRADTIILARLDADSSAITLTSIPRDLKVTIPEYEGAPAVTDKINSAFARGGVALTVKTVKDLFSTPGRPFKINHVVQVDFLGFRRLVDFLGCTMIDVDRRYFNDVGGPGGYAVIDIQPGYQKLCGEDALAYVRYRHTDNDLVRGARQQDFLRQMLRQPGVQRRLNYDKRQKIANIAGRYSRVDRSLTQNKPLFTLLKLGLNVAGKPVEQVSFGDGQVSYEGQYVTAPQAAINATRDQLLNPQTAPDAADADTGDGGGSAPERKRRKKSAVPGGLVNVEDSGQTQAIQVNRRMRFPFYYPKLGTGGYEGDARVYQVRGNQAYRMVVPYNTLEGQYYGIQGLKDGGSTLLDQPHDDITVGGRDLDVYYDGKRVRLIAWRRGGSAYYVHNTLDRALSRQQMQAIALSFTRLGGGKK